MKSVKLTFVSFALVVGLATAAHAQRTINDCEKIQAADAYNQCLAKFGPPAKTLNVESARPGDIKSGSEEAAAGAGPAKSASQSGGRHYGRGRGYSRHGRGGRVVRSHGGGRKRMTISVGR